MEALVELAADDREAAEAAARKALAILEKLRGEVHEHETQGWAFPSEIDIPAAHAALRDLAVVFAQLDDPNAAIECLSAMRGVDDGIINSIGADPILQRAVNAAALGRVRESMSMKSGLNRF